MLSNHGIYIATPTNIMEYGGDTMEECAAFFFFFN